MQRGIGCGEVLGGQLLERALTVVKRLGNVRVHLAGSVPGIELRDTIDELRSTRENGIGRDHADAIILRARS